MDYLKTMGIVADVVGIFSFIPFLVAAFLLWTRSKRYNKAMKILKEKRGEHSVAVSIGLSGQDIKGQVEAFLIREKMEIPIRPYTKDGGITPKNIQEVTEGIWKLKKDLTNEGVNEVHLFYAGPVAFGLVVGGIMNNWVPVKIYHNNHNPEPGVGGYEFWTVLNKGFVPGVEKTRTQEILDEIR